MPPQPAHRSSSVGPFIGTGIIIVLLAVGALYFWGEQLNRQQGAQNQPPYIPADTSTTTGE